MAMPEGFKTISKWPWDVDDDNAGSVFVLMDSALKSRYRYQPQHKVQLAEDLPDGKQLAEAVANANLFALAPDHALLLAAVARGVASIDGLRLNVHDQAHSFIEFRTTLDPFGCPVLSDKARTAIVKALES